MTSPEHASPTLQEVRAFYDSQTHRKLRDFVEGNERVEAGWKTLKEWLPIPCRSVLEIGCGVGAICWRLARRLPQAQVLGLDVSPRSVVIAKRLFTRPNLTFKEQLLLPGSLSEKYDCVLLMDVYEHIEPAARVNLHAAIREVLNETGRVVLTFPAPRKLSWQRVHEPEEIQPVDEEITWREIGRLSDHLGREVLCLKTMDIWQVGDYYHAVLGKIAFPKPLEGLGPRSRIGHECNSVLERMTDSLGLSRPRRQERLAMVRQAFGPEFDPADPSTLKVDMGPQPEAFSRAKGAG